MRFEIFIAVLVSYIDLSALVTLIGAACLLFMAGKNFQKEELALPILKRIRFIFLICILTLIISSVGGLLSRTLEMAHRPLAEIIPVLPIVIQKTHYGSMWLLRVAAIFAAMIFFWVGGHRANTRLYAVLMLVSAAAIAFSRSDSGHLSDFGDLSPQQLSDWLHVLAAGFWGIMISITFAIRPEYMTGNSLEHTTAGIADRFYKLFGPLMTISLFTGLYNAWHEVGSLGALFGTPYGQILLVKVLLFLLLIFRYFAPPAHGPDEAEFTKKFLKRARVDAALILAILLCVSVLNHSIPARHAAHLKMMKPAQPGISNTTEPAMPMDHMHGM